jgi:hypothetical protein
MILSDFAGLIMPTYITFKFSSPDQRILSICTFNVAGVLDRPSLTIELAQSPSTQQSLPRPLSYYDAAAPW